MLKLTGVMIIIMLFSQFLSAEAKVPWKIGEKLTFSIQFFGTQSLTAGTATLEVKGIKVFKGRKAYHIYSETNSNTAFSALFPVRDRIEAYFDIENLYSLRFEKHLREGNYSTDVVTTFDQENNTVTYDDGTVMRTPARVVDILCALYYFRAQGDKVKIGAKIQIPNHADKKNYPMIVEVQSTETVTVPAGTFECWKVEPKLESSAVFKQKGRLWVWLTKDARLMPVKMRSAISIGAIEAYLKAAEGVSSDDEEDTEE
ncbi:MAG: DUF3108 domain-containing protein [Candidatus Coatesbacteria bacterium]|nr:DUF3108 domain-containing protein [Candidatus Coatesbacteria bacterium]